MNISIIFHLFMAYLLTATASVGSFCYLIGDLLIRVSYQRRRPRRSWTRWDQTLNLASSCHHFHYLMWILITAIDVHNTRCGDGDDKIWSTDNRRYEFYFRVYDLSIHICLMNHKFRSKVRQLVKMSALIQTCPMLTVSKDARVYHSSFGGNCCYLRWRLPIIDTLHPLFCLQKRRWVMKRRRE